jgi:hypothetical protein
MYIYTTVYIYIHTIRAVRRVSVYARVLFNTKRIVVGLDEKKSQNHNHQLREQR